MPIFKHKGQQYNVDEADIKDFASEFPDAYTVAKDKDGVTYRVASGDWESFQQKPVTPKEAYHNQPQPELEEKTKSKEERSQTNNSTGVGGPVEPSVDLLRSLGVDTSVNLSAPSVSAGPRIQLGEAAPDIFGAASKKYFDQRENEILRRDFNEIMEPYISTYAKEEQRKRLNTTEGFNSAVSSVGSDVAHKLRDILNEEARAFVDADKRIWTPEDAAKFRKDVIESTLRDPIEIVPESFKQKVDKKAGSKQPDEVYFAEWLNLKGKGREDYLHAETVRNLLEPSDEDAKRLNGIKERAEANTVSLSDKLRNNDSFVNWLGGSASPLAAAVVEDSYDISRQTTRALDKAEEIKEAYVNHQNDENFFLGAGKGVKDGLTDVDNWVGAYMVGDMNILTNLVGKIDRGEKLTQQEEDYMDAQAYKLAVEAAMADDLGWGYKSGNVTGVSVPFMLQMLASPVSSTTGAVANRALVGLGKRAVNKFGGTILKNLLSKTPKAITKVMSTTASKNIGKGLSRIADATTAGAAQTMLFNADRTFADAADRHLGNQAVVGRTNEQYGTNLEAQEGESWAKSIFKSAASNTSMNASEYLGSLLISPLLTRYGDYLAKPLRETLDVLKPEGLIRAAKRTGAAKAIQTLENLHRYVQGTSRLVDDLARQAEYDGLLSEYLEEVADNVVNTAIGDMSVEDLLSPKQNAETILGLSWTSGAFNVLNKVTRTTSYITLSRKMKKADAVMREAAPEKWDKYVQELGKARKFDDIIGIYENFVEELSGEGNVESAAANIADATRYTAAYAGKMGHDAMLMSEDKKDIESLLSDARENGYSLADAQMRKEVYDRMKLLEERFGSAIEPKIEEFGGPAEFLRSLEGNVSDEAFGAVVDYMLEKERYEGIKEARADDLAAKQEASRKRIDRDTHKPSGTVITASTTDPVTKKTIGVTVVNGDLSVDANTGVVTPGAGTVVIRYANGKYGMVDISTLTGFTAMNAEALKVAFDEKLSQQEQTRVQEEESGATQEATAGAEAGAAPSATPSATPTASAPVQEAAPAAVAGNSADIAAELDKTEEGRGVKEQVDAWFAQGEDPGAVEQLLSSTAGSFAPLGMDYYNALAAEAAANAAPAAEPANAAAPAEGVAEASSAPTSRIMRKKGAIDAEASFENGATAQEMADAYMQEYGDEEGLALSTAQGHLTQVQEERQTTKDIDRKNGPLRKQEKFWSDVVDLLTPKEETVAEVAEDSIRFDNQGNPIDESGRLILEEVESIDQISDQDFEDPTRNIILPAIPDNVAEAVGTNGKPVIIKKNIFERNLIRHSDLTPDQSRDILKSALYSPDIYGQNQKRRRVNNWVVISVSDKQSSGTNKLVLLEVNENKENVEIVHWHYLDKRGMEKLKRQTEREGGQLLILPSASAEEVGALSDLTSDLPSEGKGTDKSVTAEGTAEEISENAQNATQSEQNELEKAEKERIDALVPTIEDVKDGIQTADEFVAGLFGNGIRITPESFRKETGLGWEEQRRLVGIIAGKEKGGLTVEQAAETIVENYRAELAERGFSGDSMEMRDMVIDILSSGNPRAYAKQAADRRAEQALHREMEAFDRYTQEAFHMSAEEYIMYEESMLPKYIEQYKDFDEQEYYSNFADEQSTQNEHDTTRESAETGGSREILSEEQPSATPGEGAAGEGQQGGTLQGDVQGDAQEGLARAEAGQEVADKPTEKESRTRFSTSMFEDAERIAREEQRRAPLRRTAHAWEKILGVKVTLMERLEGVKDPVARREIEAAEKKGKKVPGWYSDTEGVFLYLPHVKDVTEVDKTCVHEIVSHKGLKELLGQKKFDELCRKVWGVMSPAARKKYRSYPNVHNELEAADEYIAHLSEEVELTARERSVWQKIMDFIADLLGRKADNRSKAASIVGKETLSRKDIAELVRLSYAEYLQRNGSEEATNEAVGLREAGDSQTMLREVDDPDVIARLEASPKRRGFRNVVRNEDGTFSSPMAYWLQSTTGGAKTRVETAKFELGKWEEAEEHPELVDENGKIVLVKPDKGTVPVAYDPYIHNRLDPVNLQFKDAWKRNDLIYVETEVPTTDLESGYHADKALLPVGVHSWSNGDLMLSIYDKPIRFVPWDEVADAWAERLAGKEVHFDVVPPALRSLLVERGVDIVPPHKGMGKDCRDAYAEWKNSVDGNNVVRFRFTEEEKGIIDEAKKNGTYMKAPNGQPTNLNEKQWAQVRTKAFKKWFGDWELAAKEIAISQLKDDQKFLYFGTFKEAEAWGKNNIAQTLNDKQTNGKGVIVISRNSVEKYCSESAVRKSASKDVHFAALQLLPNVIHDGVIVENHEDFKKKGDGRSPEYGIGSPHITMHILYGAIGFEGKTYRVKVTLKEDRSNGNPVGAYSYEATKIELLDGQNGQAVASPRNSKSSISIANLLNGVYSTKQNGEKILNSSKIVDENGEPMVVYHGSEEDFNVFDKTKGRANMDIQGMFFSPWEDDARGYGSNVRAFYLNIRKPANESTGYKALKKFQGQTGAGIKAREYLVSVGYDGVNNEDQEFIAFEANQIKSATENNGEFSAENNDIRFRVTDDKPADAIRRAYDGEMRTARFLTKETMVDYLASVKALLDTIAEKTEKGITDPQNVYRAMLTLTNKNTQELAAFNYGVLPHLTKAIAGIMGKEWNGDWDAPEADTLQRYAKVKHGIERDRDMAVRRAIPRMAEQKYKEQFGELDRMIAAETDADARDALRTKKAAMLADPKAYGMQTADEIAEHMEQQWYGRIAEIRRGEGTWREKQQRMDAAIADVFGLDAEGLETYGLTLTEDYSGMTETLIAEGETDRKTARKVSGAVRAAAYDFVEKYEERTGADKTDALWDGVRAVSAYSLEKQRSTGLVDAKYVEDCNRRYEFYVPLRNFAETTADEVYDYLDETYNDNNPVKTARGRRSEAGNPFSNVMMLGYQSITAGNKNAAVQHFWNLANRSDVKGFLVPSRLWNLAELDDAQREEVNEKLGSIADTTGDVILPRIPENATAQQVLGIISDFEDVMKDLKKRGLAFQGKKRARQEYRLTSKQQENAHRVKVYVNGEARYVTIVGDPRAALALNGKLNPESGVPEKYKAMQQFLSGAFTSQNPSFALANIIRDTQHANMRAFITESGKYWAKFSAKQAAMMKPGRLAFLLAKYENSMGNTGRHGWGGELDMRNETHRNFKRFMELGGATGYTFSHKEIENLKKLADMAERAENKTPKGQGYVVGEIFDFIRLCSESAELINRFAAFEASLEAGRSEQRAISDAQEITLNFSRKGAGKKTYNANRKGKTWLESRKYNAVNAIAWLSQFGRDHIIFWNATVQGSYQTYKMIMEHPAKTTFALGGVPIALSAFALPALNAVICAFIGDDEDAYYDELPDYVRQRNLCIKNPLGRGWLKIPLDPATQKVWAAGDAIGAAWRGKRQIDYWGDLGANAVGLFSPVDIYWGDRNDNLSERALSAATSFTPTLIQPLLHSYANRDWKGKPLYNDSRYIDQLPSYAKSFKSDKESLKALSKFLNDVGNSDADSYGRTWHDFATPGVMEELLYGYTGGYGQLALAAVEGAIAIVSDDAKGNFRWDNMPVVNRLWVEGDPGQTRLNIYRNYRDTAVDFMENVEQRRSQINREYNEAKRSHDTLAQAEALTKMKQLHDGDYQRYEILNNSDKLFQKYMKGSRIEDVPDFVIKGMLEAIEIVNNPDGEKEEKKSENDK